ncbi:MAG TPA: MotA/TolQ/ExbB proton channel family protein [Candidatus Enterousia avicola]|uniref:MotA/TolQ/ExbB proton channel family protein n=1 Tax=Candidatus Enterousia avicola TaxID=2840787 RepID=A0A9D1MRU5_9PROT|nr:MotA/TolQ/ExbB proton channel family protein [Candidatus Enterousia avicola]
MTNTFSLLTLFTGDIMTLFISLVLVLGSIMSWAVIIEKIRIWHFQKKNPVRIKSGDNLSLIADKLIRPFDKNLWFLSMVSYVAPFIGLFGTIWGVMDSFASIGVNQSVSIGVIAPGLATALGTTALGLIAAVPAAIAYQYFSKKSDDLYDKLIETCKEMKDSKSKK